MALLQVLVRVPDRFSELADMVMTRTLTEAGDATRVDLEADQNIRPTQLRTLREASEEEMVS